MMSHLTVLKSLCRTIRFRTFGLDVMRARGLAYRDSWARGLASSLIGVPDFRLLILFIPLLFTNSGCVNVSFFSSRDPVNNEKDPFTIKKQIIIAENTIYQNNRSGLRIRGNTPVNISKCDIYHNGTAGINLEHSAKVVIEKCNIFQNKGGGIAANNATQVLIKKSFVLQNEQGGIRIRQDKKAQPEPAYVLLKQNKIFLNKQGGIHTIANTPYPIQLTVSGNSIYRNLQTGIRIENNVRMTAVNNKIYKNGTAGISAYITADHPPVLDVYQNNIYFNSGAGIFIHSGITGKIGLSNNLIYNNHRAGIACGLWGETGSNLIDLEIFHNTIVANGSAEEGAGIRNDSRGDVIIKNNIIAYNFTTGIIARGCGDTSYNLLFANGETSTVEDTSSNLFFLTEKVQYAGCTGRQWGDVVAAPLFINPDQYNFSLQEDSPAKNAADTIKYPYFQDMQNRDLGASPFLTTKSLQERP